MARPSKKSRQSGSGLAELAAHLTKRLADANPSSNLVFSPLSIYAAVALLAPGARGATLDEVLRLLGARSREELEESISRVANDALQDLSGSGGPSVAFACGVWNDERRPLKPAYREAVVGTYRAEARSLDFRENSAEAARHINAWVAEVTRNLIDDVVSPSDVGMATDVVLANAIYFKGKWNLPFRETATRDRPFHRLDGTAVDAPFMYNPARQFIAVHDGFKVLKLQYKMRQRGYQPTQYSMCIFLPDAYDGLRSLVDEITSRPGFVHDHLPVMPVKVGDFGVPKFKLNFSSRMAEILKQLGLVLPFGQGSDLLDMVEDDGAGSPLLVQEVIHKAVIEVNEEGTEAAALTMPFLPPGCSRVMMSEPMVDFVADHPFAYFIVEEASGAILFAGHVVDPTNGSSTDDIGQPKEGDAFNEQRLPARGYELPVTKNPSVQFDVAGPTGNPGSSGLAALAVGLSRRLADGSADDNLVFSPLSIYTALALLAAGARDATLDEILGVLGARSRSELENFVSHMAADALQDRSASGGPRVAFACGVWSDLTRRLKPAFREAVVGTYKAEASSVDFRSAPEAARRQINAWAAQVTRNLIDSVLPPGSISPETRVVLGNAMYFKGKWEDQPFDKRHTAHKPFHRLDRSQVDVPFMQSWESQFVAVHDGFKVLKLRYKMAAPDDQEQAHPPFDSPVSPGYTQFSMCIFLPDAHDGLLGLLDTIVSRPGFLQDHLPEEQITLGEFRVPKFKLSFNSSLVAVLKKLGLKLPFCLEGDLSDMVEDGGSGLPVVVGDVIHKAVVEVNEEGTEAAAVTMVISSPGCAPMGSWSPPPQVDFIADHPFAYYIVEEATGAVVFAGHVLDPSKE
ncbi:uncharacterized protein [Aegilops tauschii subsp. strangulata]|uniref:uncharacterized protein n=1 Tax=Aegilops tauschii subsp. strangulata TaxID=200361 RepID=UPI003CC88E47